MGPVQNNHSPIIDRLVHKLSSVHQRIDNLTDKKKLHHVLHSAYRPGKRTIPAAKKHLEALTGVSAETSTEDIAQLLAGKNLKELQTIDRLVKPDPRIYLHQGKAVSFDDLKNLGRSPIEKEIQEKLQAVDLKKDPQQLIKDLETYGFAIIDCDEEEKSTIEDIFQKSDNYLKATSVKEKQLLNPMDPSIDAEYRKAKKPEEKSKSFRSMENIVAQRPFIFDTKYDKQWQDAKASDLREDFQDLADLLESKSQEVLEHIAKLFKLQVDFFKDFAYDSDQSTIRLIQCISQEQQDQNPDKYFDESSKKTKIKKDEPEDSCVGIHTDWGLVTLLPTAYLCNQARDAETAISSGLEFWYNDVKGNGKNSGWVSPKSKPGQLLLMPGNVAEIITGGKLKSVPHRVISQGDRVSLAYFTEVKKDTNIDRLKQIFIDKKIIDKNSLSLFEDEARPYLNNPEQALTGENYLLYMIHRNTANLNSKVIDYARRQGLFLKN